MVSGSEPSAAVTFIEEGANYSNLTVVLRFKQIPFQRSAPGVVPGSQSEPARSGSTASFACRHYLKIMADHETNRLEPLDARWNECDGV